MTSAHSTFSSSQPSTHTRIFFVLLAICALALLPLNHLAAQATIPSGTANYLGITGGAGNGDADGVQVVFFRIPDTFTENLYFAIYDPDLNDADSTNNHQVAPPDYDDDSVANFSTYYTLVGGTGAYTNDVSRQISMTPAEALTGTQIYTLTYGRDTYPLQWVYFPAISPSAGEHVGSYYYFKIVIEADANVGKNGYRLDVSTSDASSSTVYPVTGAQSFAYNWDLSLLQQGSTWNLYPFIPYQSTGNITAYNFDADGYASAMTLYDYSNTSVGVGISGNNATASGVLAISGDGETNRTWHYEIVESGAATYVNNAEFYVLDNSSNPLAVYSTEFVESRVPDHVVAVEETSSLVTNGTARVSFQLVDTAGDVVPYSYSFDVTIDAGTFVDDNNGGGAGAAGTRTITSDNDGMAWIDITSTTAATVNITIADNGYDFPETSAHAGTSVTFADNPAPVLTGSYINLIKDQDITGTALGLDLVITDTGTNDLAAGYTVQIDLPAGLTGLTFNTTNLTVAVAGGTGVVGAITNSSNQISFPITTTVDSAGGAYIQLTDLRFDGAPTTAGANNFTLSEASASFTSSSDTATITVTSNNAVWDGDSSTAWELAANWVGDTLPSDDFNVRIPGGLANYPVLSADSTFTVNELNVESGATLDLASYSITTADTVTNAGTIYSVGAGSGLNIDSNTGTVEYTGGTSLVVTSGGAGVYDYYDLIISGGTFTAGTAVNVANNFTLSGGTLTLGADLTVGAATDFAGGSLNLAANNFIQTDGNITVSSTAGTFSESGGYIVIDGTTVLTPSTETLPSIQVGNSGSGASLTVSADLILSGDLVASAAETTTLDISGIQLTIGSNLDFSSLTTLTDDASTSYVLNGNGILTSGGKTFRDTTISTGSTLQLADALDINGNLVVAGTGTLDLNDQVVSASGNITLAAPSTLTLGGASDEFVFDGTSTLTANGKTLPSLTISSATATGDLTLADANVIVSGNITGGAQTSTVDFSGATIRISGDYDLRNINSYTADASTNLIFTGTSNVYSNGNTFAGDYQVGSATNAATVVQADDLTITGDISGGGQVGDSWDVTGVTILTSGDIDLSAIETLTDSGPSGVFSFTGNVTPQTLTGNGGTVGSIVLNKTNTTDELQIAGSFTADSALTLTQGVLRINAGNTLTSNVAVTVPASGNATVIVDGGATSGVLALGGNDLTINGGSVTLNTGTSAGQITGGGVITVGGSSGGSLTTYGDISADSMLINHASAVFTHHSGGLTLTNGTTAINHSLGSWYEYGGTTSVDGTITVAAGAAALRLGSNSTSLSADTDASITTADDAITISLASTLYRGAVLDSGTAATTIAGAVIGDSGGSGNLNLELAGTGTSTVSSQIGTAALPLDLLWFSGAGSAVFSADLYAHVLNSDSAATTLGADVTLGNNGIDGTGSYDVYADFVGTLDGAYNLTLNYGLDNGSDNPTNFAAAVGGGTAIGDGSAAALIILSPGDTTFGNTLTLADGITQDTAAGLLTLSGNVNITGTTATTTLDADVTLDGITFASAGTVTFGDAVTDQLTLTTGASSISTAGAYDLTFNSLVDGAQALTLDAGTGNVSFAAAVGSGTALGSLTLTNSAAATFSSTVDITGALAQTNAATGTTTFSNTVSVGSASLDGTDFSIQNSFASGGVLAITNSGTVTKSSTGNITSTGAFSTSGDVNLAANITTTNSDLTIGGNLVLAEASSVTLSSGAGAGNITVGVDTDGTAGGVSEDLTVNAGTGTLTFTGAVGSSVALGNLTLTNSAAAIFGSSLTVTTALTQTNAATGTTTFSGAVNVGSASLDGTDFSIQNSFASGGALAITNSGTVTKSSTGDITSTGVFSTSGDVNIAANITTTNNNLTIGGNLVLAEASSVTLSSGAGAGNISLGGDTDGTAGGVSEDLTVNAGTGTLTFTGAVGSSVALGSLSATTTGTLSFAGNVTTTGTQTLTGGTVTTNGTHTTTANDIAISGALDLAADTVLDTGSGTAGDVTLSSTVDAAVADTQGLTVTSGSGSISITGPIGGTRRLKHLDLSSDAAFAAPALNVNTYLYLTFGGAVTQTGALTGTTLWVKTLNNAGAAITLTNASNDFTTVVLETRDASDSADVSAAISYVDSDDFDLGTLGALGAGIRTTGDASLTSGTTQTQSGHVVSGGLEVIAGGAVTYTNASNAITNLAAAVSGANAFSYTDADALSITTVGGTNGITTGGGAVSIITTAGTLDVSQAIASSGGAVTLNSAAGDVTTSAGITAGAVDIDGTNITLAGAMTVSGNIDVDATGTLDLTNTIAFTTGALTLDSASGTTISAAGDLTASGAGTVTIGGTLAGALSTAGDVTTVGGAITFTRAVSLGGDVSITSGSGSAGDITFSSTADGAQALTLDAGTGSVVLVGAMGSGTALGTVTISSATNVAGDAGATVDTGSMQMAVLDITASGTVRLAAVTAGSDVTIAGTGPVALNGTFSSGGNVDIDGTNITLAGAMTVSGNIDVDATGTLGITNTIDFTTGALTLDSASGTTISAAGDLTASGAGMVTIGGTLTGTLSTAGDVTTVGGAITFTRAVSLSGDVNITSGSGSAGDITFSSTVDGAQALTLDAGTGNVNFATAVGLGTALSSLTLTNSAAATFSSTVDITGALAQTNAATGTTTFSNTVSVGSASLDGTDFSIQNSFASGGTLAITNSGTVTKSSTGNITSTGAFSTSGDVNLAANITTTNSDLTIGGNLVLAEASSVTLSSGAGAGNITIGVDTDGTAGGVSEDLTVNAGTGTLTFTGAVGSSVALGNLTLTNSAAATFSSSVVITTALTQTNAATGTTTFSGAVSVGSASLDGTDFTIQNAFTSGGALAITNSGTVTKSNTGNITSTGVFSTSGDVNIAANITTANNNLTIGGNLVLAEASSVTLSSGAGAGNISLGGDTDATAGGVSEDLTVNAGTGTLTFTGAVGSSIALGSLSATTTGTLSFAGNVTTTGTQTLTGGTVSTNGTHTTTTGGNITISGALDLASNTVLDTSSGGNVSIGSTVDAAVADIQGLAVYSGSGTIGITGPIGATRRLAHLILSSDSAFSGPVLDVANDLTLTFGGAVTQTGPWTGANLWVKTLNNAGAAITLTNASNDFTTVVLETRNAADSADVSAAISYVDSDDFDLGTLGALGAGIRTTGDASLTSGTTQTQSGHIVSGGLEVIAGGAVTYTNASNAITNLAAAVSGANAFSYTDADALSITTVGGTNGITTGGGAVSIITTAGTLDVSQAIASSGGAVSLASSAADATISAAITSGGGSVDIDANTTTTVAATGPIDAGGGAVSFNSASAGTVVSAGDVTSSDGSIRFYNALQLSGSVNYDTSGSTGGDIQFDAAVTQDGTAWDVSIDAGTAGDVVIASGFGSGSALGTVTISSATNVAGDASATADTGSMQMAVLDITASGTVRLAAVTAGSDVTIAGTGPVALNGTFSSGGNVDIDGTNITLAGAMTVSGNIDVDATGTLGITNTIDFTAGALALDSASGTTISAAGDLTASGAGTVTIGGTLTGTLSTAGDVTTVGGAITFTRAVSLGGAVAVTSGAAVAGDILFSANVNGAQNLSVDSGTGAVTFNGSIGAATALAALSVTGADINMNGNTVDTTSTQTFTGPVDLLVNYSFDAANADITFAGDVDANVSGGQSFAVDAGTGTVTLTGANGVTEFSTVSLTGADVVVTGTDLRTTGIQRMYTTGGLYLKPAGNLTIDAAGNDIIVNDVYINTTGTITVADVSAVAVDGFYFYNGTLDIANTTATSLYTQDDFVVLGYAGANDIDDPDLGASFWQYPGAAMTNIATDSGGVPYTAAFSDLSGVTIRVGRSGDGVTYGAENTSANFYVNTAALPASAAWNLYLPDNRSAAPVVSTAADWGTPYAISIGASTITNASVATNTIIAANIITNTQTSGGGGTYTGSSNYSPGAISTYYTPATRVFATDAIISSDTALLGSTYTPTYGFDTTVTQISAAYTVKDDVVYITFNRPLMNTSGELVSSLAVASGLTIGGLDVGDTPYLVPFWTESTGNALYAEATSHTEPYRAIISADFDYIDAFAIKMNPGDTWTTDSDGLVVGTGTDSEGVAAGSVTVGAVTIDWPRGLIRGSNGADFVRPAAATPYTGTVDNAGPVLYSVEVGRMGPSADEFDGHNFLTLKYSEDVLFDSSAISGLFGTSTRADEDFSTGTYGGDFENATLDIDADTTAEVVVHVDGYLYYTNNNYAAGTTPEFITGSRENDGVNAAVDGSGETVNSLVASSDSELAIYLAGYYDGTYWPGWHFLVPDPYAPNTSLEVEQNDLITDANGNTIDALESTRSMMATLNSVQRPYSPEEGGYPGTVAVTTPFDSHSYSAGTDFDFWDVAAPVISSYSTAADASALYPGVRDYAPNYYEIVLGENATTQLIESFDIFIQDNGIAIPGSFQTSEDNLVMPGVWSPATDHDTGGTGAPYSVRPYTDASGVAITDANTYRGIRDSSATYAGNLTTVANAFDIGEKDDAYSTALNAATLLGEFRSLEPQSTLFRQDDSIIAVADDPYFRLYLVDSTTAGWDNLTELFMTYNHANSGYITDLAGNLMPSSRPEDMTSAFGSAYAVYAINPFPETGSLGELGKLLTIERTPPEIRLALAAVGGNRVYIKFSEPVWADTALTTQVDASNFTISAGTINVTNVITLASNSDFSASNTPGLTEAYLVLDQTLTADDLFNMTIDFQLTIKDKADNSPAAATRQITDVGIGIIDPVWATDGIQQDTTRGSGFSALRVFDGSSGLDDYDMTIESAIAASSYYSLPVSIYFDVNVPDSYKAELLDGSTGEYWSPVGIQGLIDNANTDARMGSNISADTSSGISQHLIPSGDSEIERGVMLEFFYRVGPLMAATIDDPNQPLQLRPWKIDLDSVAVQRGGVTILNNVINPDAGDTTVLNYVVERAGMVSVQVFTLDGDLVSILQRGRQGTGTFNLSWDGTNNNGDIVARGFYFIRAVGPGFDEVRKVLVVRPY